MIFSRIEQKFIVNINQYYFLKGLFDYLCQSDANSMRDGTYPVFSQYLDTNSQLAFQEKNSGDLERTKVRIRTYSTNLLDQSSYFLEFKEKDDLMQKKLRVKFNSYNDALANSTQTILNSSQIKNFSLFPVANVYYERQAYQTTIDQQQIRINFDSNILALFPTEVEVKKHLLLSRRIIPSNYVVLEIKSSADPLPSLLQKLLAEASVKKISFSKYVYALKYINNIKENFYE